MTWQNALLAALPIFGGQVGSISAESESDAFWRETLRIVEGQLERADAREHDCLLALRGDAP